MCDSVERYRLIRQNSDFCFLVKKNPRSITLHDMLVPIDEPPCYSSRTQKSTKKPKAWWLPFFTPLRRQCCPSPTRTYRQGTVGKMVSIFFDSVSGAEIVVRTLRISLFRTLQICWMSAALWETASRELPDRTSSSFWALETSTSTPCCMTTRRTSFSPMKLLLKSNLVSTSDPSHGSPLRLSCDCVWFSILEFLLAVGKKTYRISTS